MDTKLLIKILEKLKAGVSDQFELSKFAFFDGKYVTSFNFEIGVSLQFESEELKGALPVKELLAILKKLKNEDLEIIKNDAHIIFGCGTMELGLNLVDHKNPLEVGGIEDWRSLPEGFKDAVRFCLPFASGNTSHGIAQCVVVRDEAVYASDNNRFIKHEIAGSVKGQIAIPKKNAETIMSYDIKEYDVSKAWVHFRDSEGAVFSCRMFAGTYPDINRIIFDDWQEVNIPDNLLDAIIKVSDLSQDVGKMMTFKGKVINLDIRDNQIVVSGENSSGWITEVLECDNPNIGTQKISMNSNSLIPILPYAKRLFISPTKVLVEGDDFKYGSILIPRGEK
jgi:hypothetical protein